MTPGLGTKTAPFLHQNRGRFRFRLFPFAYFAYSAVPMGCVAWFGFCGTAYPTIRGSALLESIHSGIYNTPSSNEIPRHAERHFY